ncbi:hypothetical protein C3469_02110 [Mycobacterium kansasii]|nr:hypothetical protein C3B43_00390 [Mycobacterium kansasii]POY04477.1 hypothetical protein C3479_02185 [Mycobacterium kansasii]POY24456.1 hypothetical protein C3476_04350 [Mycobacterium kansasii]POY29711.1 hypothetical protein C3469_02110 [Mycobacterium kansasii]POY34351.1 hypothetical protein C3478_01530 [Mycobacterium kansasii]
MLGVVLAGQKGGGSRQGGDPGGGVGVVVVVVGSVVGTVVVGVGRSEVVPGGWTLSRGTQV